MKTALVCIARDEDNYIDEWIDYNLKIGFDKIFVFANEWEYLSSNPSVEVIPHESQQYKLNMQRDAYNKAISVLNGVYDWVAFFDVDEYICLKKHSNIKDFIKEFYPHRPNAIAVNWVFYGDNGLTEVDVDYSLLKRFTKRQEVSDRHIKVILNLRRNHCFQDTHPHSTNLEWMDQSFKTGMGPFNPGGCIDIAQINHYWCKTIQEYMDRKLPMGKDWGPYLSRKEMDFHNHNHNEIEDTTARDFYFSHSPTDKN